MPKRFGGAAWRGYNACPRISSIDLWVWLRWPRSQETEERPAKAPPYGTRDAATPDGEDEDEEEDKAPEYFAVIGDITAAVILCSIVDTETRIHT
jgi:hypothetical protein